MEPDEVVRAVSAGCMTACCTSRSTPTGAARVKVGCMVVTESAVSGSCEIGNSSDFRSWSIAQSRRSGGGATATRVFGSGRTVWREIS